MSTNLAKIRKERGLSQSSLSNKVGVSLNSIKSYELRRRDINKAEALTVYRLAQALDCEVGDLLELEEE